MNPVCGFDPREDILVHEVPFGSVEAVEHLQEVPLAVLVQIVQTGRAAKHLVEVRMAQAEEGLRARHKVLGAAAGALEVE